VGDLAVTTFGPVAQWCAGGHLRGQVADYLRGREDVRDSSHVRARVERPRVHEAGRAIVQSHRRPVGEPAAPEQLRRLLPQAPRLPGDPGQSP
jgi:hypothetical protein